MNRKTDDRGDKVGEFDRAQHGGGTQRHGNGQMRHKLPPEVHAFLGHRLRAAYRDLVDEPIPAPLLDLLERLKAQEMGDGAGGDTALNTSQAKEKA